MSIQIFSSLIDSINVHYDRDFLSIETANRVLNLLERDLVYNTDEESKIKIFGKSMKIPRQQVAYGEPGTYYNFWV